MIKRKLNTLKITLASLDIDLEEEAEEGISFSLDKILEDVDQYDKVFLTETGSTYLSKDGSCQRWKKMDDYWHLQPKTQRLFFLDKNNKEKLISEMKNQEYLPYEERGGIELAVVDCAIGRYPLELGVEGYGSSPDILEWDDKIIIRLIGPFHLGHKITKIIK